MKPGIFVHNPLERWMDGYQRIFHIIFPKHYFWHRGFDGLYGTVVRRVQTLSQCQPRFSEKVKC